MPSRGLHCHLWSSVSDVCTLSLCISDECVLLIRMSVQPVSETPAPGDEVPLDEDEEELRKALALSRQHMEVEDEEADLRRAIQLSMQGEKHTPFVTRLYIEDDVEE